MLNKCKTCSRKTIKAGYPLCLNCWRKTGSPAKTSFSKGNISNIPTKEEYIKEKVATTQWDRMGHWEQAGKGGIYIDNSPGSGTRTFQLVLAFVGVTFLLSGEYIGIILLLISFLLEIPIQFFRKKYLEHQYDSKHLKTNTSEKTRDSDSEVSN